MFRLTMAGGLVLGLAVSGANAADLIIEEVPEPVVTSPFTGFYLGGFIGHAGASFDGLHDGSEIDPDDEADFELIEVFYNNPRTHMVYGGYLGYNVIDRGWLFGLEGDIGFGDLTGIASGFPPEDNDTLTHEIDWFGTFRARFGATRGNTLLYATGGLAYATSTLTTDQGPEEESRRGSKDLHNFTYVIGTGFAHAFAPNWSWRAEALYFGPMNTHTLSEDELVNDTDAGDYAQIDGMYQLRFGLTYHIGGNQAYAPASTTSSPYDGFYAGAFAGWGAASLIGVIDQGEEDVAEEEHFNGYESGGVYGGYLGYNIVNDGWLFGLEGDIGAAHISGEAQDDDDEDLDRHEHEIDWIGSVRARFGVQNGNALLYATGGLAYATSTLTLTDDALGDDDGPNKGEANLHSFGYVVGAGMEYMFGGNWSARVEGLYYGPMNKHTFRDEQINSDQDASDYVQIDGMYQVRAGIAYHF